MLEDRKKNGKINQKAVESYAKSAKALLQVGDSKTDDYKRVMDYPVEFIPTANPYVTKVGSDISFQLLSEGAPLANHLVYVGNRAPDAKPDTQGHSHNDTKLRTDEKGMITVNIDHTGYWYLRTIHMVESEDSKIDYISNWATLTFEIR